MIEVGHIFPLIILRFSASPSEDFCRRKHRAKLRIIVPCSEVIRECFGPSPLLLRLVLTGQFLPFTYSKELSFFEHKDYLGALLIGITTCFVSRISLVQDEIRRITLRAIAHARTEGHYSIAARLPFAGDVEISGRGLEYCVESILSELSRPEVVSFAPV